MNWYRSEAVVPGIPPMVDWYRATSLDDARVQFAREAKEFGLPSTTNVTIRLATESEARALPPVTDELTKLREICGLINQRYCKAKTASVEHPAWLNVPRGDGWNLACGFANGPFAFDVVDDYGSTGEEDGEEMPDSSPATDPVLIVEWLLSKLTKA